ncbi:Carbonic anhydrase alpha-class protein [Dioscorea alata]|uniref:Carbonic anhydrase alpha-class protein n=1 Tax=Dioscorea alata TaxID=55571 RepID=A0ACB7UQC6_DIOAL|nr:Carbonic anhydrase alpha-class protein [Dioscorea alata]
MSSSTLFHLFLLSSLLFSCFSNARLDGDDDFSYIEGSPNGPENWGNLRPEWKTCGYGMEQSPINLCDDRVIRTPALGKLRTNYQAARATVKNNGHDIMVYFKSDAGSQFINQVEYQLKRIHFHSPSEHALSGERYDLEVQMVHESQDQRRAHYKKNLKSAPKNRHRNEFKYRAKLILAPYLTQKNNRAYSNGDKCILAPFFLNGAKLCHRFLHSYFLLCQTLQMVLGTVFSSMFATVLARFYWFDIWHGFLVRFCLL